MKQQKRRETVEEFMARGGQVKVCPPIDEDTARLLEQFTVGGAANPSDRGISPDYRLTMSRLKLRVLEQLERAGGGGLSVKHLGVVLRIKGASIQRALNALERDGLAEQSAGLWRAKR